MEYMSLGNKGMVALSRQRKQILDFITVFTSERDYVPSARDLTDGCYSSSPSFVKYHLNALERNGYISRDRGISRSTRVTQLYDNEKELTPSLVSQ